MMGVVEQVRLQLRLPAPDEARAILTEAGLSHGRVAEHLGVDRVTVGRWLSGERRPRGENLQCWVELLDLIQEELDRAS